MAAQGSPSTGSKASTAKKARPSAAEIRARDTRIAELERELGMQSTVNVTAKPPPPVAVNGHALIDLDDGAEPEPLKRAPLFKAGGKTYSAVTNPPPQWGFEALTLAGGADGLGPESGMAASQVFILRRMLGDDGLRVLRDRESINPEKLVRILSHCSRLVYGAMEAPKTS